MSFTWKNYRQNGKSRVMTLQAHEFIRRFLLHTLPDGFHRIRHYGFLANGQRNHNIGVCRQRLGQQTSTTPKPSVDGDGAEPQRTRHDLPNCPECGGIMHKIAIVPPCHAGDRPFHCDTS